MSRYGTDALSKWVNSVNDNASFVWYHSGNLLGRGHKVDDSYSLQQFTRKLFWRDTEKELRVCSPERAILEVSDGVPHRFTFKHADKLM